MSNIEQSEFTTQKRVIELFEQQLGYSDLGSWRAKTKAMKQGMMQELLTGKTRLIVDNNP